MAGRSRVGWANLFTRAIGQARACFPRASLRLSSPPAAQGPIEAPMPATMIQPEQPIRLAFETPKLNIGETAKRADVAVIPCLRYVEDVGAMDGTLEAEQRPMDGHRGVPTHPVHGCGACPFDAPRRANPLHHHA